MSKKIDYNNGGVDAFSNFIASEPQKEPNKASLEDNKIITSDDDKTGQKELKTSNKTASDDIDNKLTYDDAKKRYNKTNNYTITFKIDADITDYLKHIEYVTFIESAKQGNIKSTTKTEYVNNLIRQDLLKLLNLDATADAETIHNKWLEYKKVNNL